MAIELLEIKDVERLDDFDGEYVYDLEVDEHHNFFANDILVHNSIYVEFGRICSMMGITDNKLATRFVVDMWNYGCGPYMDNKYEEYAKKFNCPKNLQALELEKIADTAVMLAKKCYAMSECFLEPNIYVTPGEHVLYKGIELVKGGTPPFARKCLDEFYRYVLKWYSEHSTAPDYMVLFSMVKQFKADFMKQSIDDISRGITIGDYNKFVLDDKNKLWFLKDEIELRNQGLPDDQKQKTVATPIQIRAAAIANYILNKPENKKYKMKYSIIHERDKVKFYKSSNPKYEVFAFLPGKFPTEFVNIVPVDYNQQFEDTILNPINRVLAILKYTQLTPEMTYHTALF